jgi:septal ring factor EnvC (AmiA/AmiB activator)
MNVKYHISGIILSCGLLAISSCDHKPRSENTRFTKVDSLTETYLDLKDNMLETWNAMINDDNQKLKAMQNVLHELTVSNPSQHEELENYQERLDHLWHSRYTQKSIANTQVVEEYDFASNSLVSELISMAESQKQFAYNTTLQKLVEIIRTADQRVNNYRQEYDSIASAYNRFIESNKVSLKEIDEDSFLEKKPLFQMVADD